MNTPDDKTPKQPVGDSALWLPLSHDGADPAPAKSAIAEIIIPADVRFDDVAVTRSATRPFEASPLLDTSKQQPADSEQTKSALQFIGKLPWQEAQHSNNIVTTKTGSMERAMTLKARASAAPLDSLRLSLSRPGRDISVEMRLDRYNELAARNDLPPLKVQPRERSV